MAEPNWHRIDKAPKGIGPLLLRAGSGPSDPAYVGFQDPDTGRWYSAGAEVRPLYFAQIPEFDCDEAGS